MLGLLAYFYRPMNVDTNAQDKPKGKQKTTVGDETHKKLILLKGICP